MEATFKTEMLIYQSEGKLDRKILSGKMTHILLREIRKRLLSVLYGKDNAMFHSRPLFTSHGT